MSGQIALGMRTSVVMAALQGHDDVTFVDSVSLGESSQHRAPRLVVQTVSTGGLVSIPSVPQWARHRAVGELTAGGLGVLVLDLGVAKYETGVLLEMITAVGREVRSGRFGNAIMVIATTQPSVAKLADMVAYAEDLPMFIVDTPTELHEARPAGRLTSTERESLDLVDQLGGRVTANRFAAETSLEVTAAGNRLTNLARRGYVMRVPRSRRQGDEFIGLTATFDSVLNGDSDESTAANQLERNCGR